MNGMKINLLLAGLLLATFALTFTHCTDPIDIGGEILAEDQASVGYTDTFSLVTRTIAGDSVSVYNLNAGGLSRYFLGRTEDPFFGAVETSLYLQPLLLRDAFTGLIEQFRPTSFTTIDSIVLVLPLDTTGVIGDVSGPFGLEVYELSESIAYLDATQTYYSSTDLAVKPGPVGVFSGIPSFDTTFVTDLIVEGTNDTASYGRQLRIPLSASLGEFFLSQDTSFFQNDSLLLEQFYGLFIKPSGLTNGLLDIDFDKPWGGIYLYAEDRGDKINYALPINVLSAHINRYEHDFTTGLVQDFLEAPEKGDSLLFLQGLEGLLVEVEIPGMDALQDRVINKAELELTVATLDGYDLEETPPVDQIFAYYRNDDGGLSVIEDIATGIDFGAVDLSFGGFPEEDDAGTFTYRLNISVHLQYMISGVYPDKIILAVFPRAANAGRLILNGPGAAERPARLKVAFTDL
jgi:hypothetical protein